jgi:5-dehydro-4-deoxyglucarate dehydratase
MKAAELRTKLYGAVAFPVTPFNSDLSLNIRGLRRNLQVLLQQRISAVVAAGGTGEMYSLTPAEHLAVTR